MNKEEVEGKETEEGRKGKMKKVASTEEGTTDARRERVDEERSGETVLYIEKG